MTSDRELDQRLKGKKRETNKWQNWKTLCVQSILNFRGERISDMHTLFQNFISRKYQSSVVDYAHKAITLTRQKDSLYIINRFLCFFES